MSSLPESVDALDERARTARDWALAELRLTPATASFAPASADASFRRYFRIEAPASASAVDATSWIVMDAPPEREDCGPFIQVASLLHGAGLNAPRILARDLERGFLLLSDLGRQTYLQVINEANADALMADAIDALIRWQLASVPNVLPRYDNALLQRELRLFPDWYVVRHLQTALGDGQAARLACIERMLIDSALAQPRVYVHRDYMPRNLMLASDNPGILDFQDAVEGPLTYDLVSLFRDAFLSWPEERIVAWRRQYLERARRAGLPLPDDIEFARAFDWMGVQRHLKVIGIFARICYRDGKPHYLADVPRFIGYVRSVAARYRELTPLLHLFDELGMSA